MAQYTMEDARDFIKSQVRDYAEGHLQKDKQRKGYICPKCGNGTGSNGGKGDGIKYHNGRFKCFTCGESFDTCDLIKAVEGTDKAGAWKIACEMYGIEIVSGYGKGEKPTMKAQTKQATQTVQTVQTVQQERDFREEMALYYEDIEKALPYLAKRGISRTTAERHKIGYCENWSCKDGVPTTPRVIIPTGANSYMARRTDGVADFKNQTKAGMKKDFMNKEIIAESLTPIFIVEGEINALSIEELGYSVVAISSKSNAKSFVEYVKENKPISPLIIALDNDYTKDIKSGDATAQAQRELVKSLKEAGIEAYGAEDIYGKHNDANDYLVADRQGFAKSLAFACNPAGQYIKKHSASGNIGELKKRLQGYTENPIPTGFTAFDTILDGGLYAGLYSMGAISSLGKTTFTLQVADNIARAGQDVLFFSLEMSRAELMAKSVSRETIEIGIIENGAIYEGRGQSTRAILKGGYGEESRTNIEEAISRYERYSNHIFIIEGMGNIGVAEIREAIIRHTEYTGNKPVVFIDYLQIIAPATDKIVTDKQNVDKTILELKRVSRDFNIPVFVISSVSRAFYNQPITLEAFKESGAIEYGSDVVIGLQIAGIEDIKGNGKEGKIKEFTDKAYSETPRKVELKVLKNRNSATRQKIELSFYPKYNYYWCAQKDTTEFGFWNKHKEAQQAAQKAKKADKKTDREQPKFDGEQKRLIEKAEE